jgi:hypothetical protein
MFFGTRETKNKVPLATTSRRRLIPLGGIVIGE